MNLNTAKNCINQDESNYKQLSNEFKNLIKNEKA